MERVIRNKVVEYKVTFLPRGNEAYIYIGSMWAGRIMYSGADALREDNKYGVFLQLPGMWGPVAREDSLNTAKLAAVEAINRWLSKFSDTPEPPPDALVKALAKKDKAETGRVRRTRAAAPAPVVRKVTRVRR